MSLMPVAANSSSTGSSSEPEAAGAGKRKQRQLAATAKKRHRMFTDAVTDGAAGAGSATYCCLTSGQRLVFGTFAIDAQPRKEMQP